MTPSDLEFHVLLALGDGPSHGYAIGKDVADQSGGRLDPTTGALYQALRRLTEEGLIAPAGAPDEVDSRRKYFALTRQGRRVAAKATLLRTVVWFGMVSLLMIVIWALTGREYFWPVWPILGFSVAIIWQAFAVWAPGPTTTATAPTAAEPPSGAVRTMPR